MTVDVNIVSSDVDFSGGGGGGGSTTPSNTIPQMSSGGFISAAISAAATSPVAFSNQACKQLTVANNDPTNTLWVTQDLGNPSFPVLPTVILYTVWIDERQPSHCDLLRRKHSDIYCCCTLGSIVDA